MSLGAARAAPLAICKPTPMSRGMHMAKVVLPRPGGPSKRIWPSGSPRFDGRIHGDFQPRVDLPLPDHVAHPLRAEIAVFVVGTVNGRVGGSVRGAWQWKKSEIRNPKSETKLKYEIQKPKKSELQQQTASYRSEASKAITKARKYENTKERPEDRRGDRDDSVYFSCFRTFGLS